MKNVLITGATGGIGHSLVRVFHENGYNVCATGTNVEKLSLLEKKYDTRFKSIKCDLSDNVQINDLIRKSNEFYGSTNILINNAGTAATTDPIPFENLDMITEERWQQIIHTNVIGPFRCSRIAASTLKERKGCIVNTASIAGIGNAGSSIAYSNSKAAIISQTRCLARALAPEIRVNAVAPGLTRTAWTDPWNNEGKQVSIEASLLKRMVEPEDIAQGMLFLVVNPAITGQTIVIDNGRLPLRNANRFNKI